MASFVQRAKALHRRKRQERRRMETIWFWLTATAMALAVVAVLVRSLYRASGEAPPAASADLQGYRDQLAEADRDLARGTLTGAEAQRVKTEIARRILEADRALQADTTVSRPAARATGLAAVVAGGTVLAALAVYERLGCLGTQICR